MKRLLLTTLMLVGFAVMDVSAEDKPESDTQPAAVKVRPADTDKDGKVSKEEFLAQAKKNAEKAGNEFKEKRAENIFAKKDTNQDGFLTAEDKVKKTAPKEEESADTEEP